MCIFEFVEPRQEITEALWEYDDGGSEDSDDIVGLRVDKVTYRFRQVD